MYGRSSVRGLRTPDRLDVRFGVVAGLYVATLLSPPVALVVVERLQLRSGLLALGVLTAVGTVVTAVVAWRVRPWGGLVAWSSPTWLPLLVPAVGVLPVVAYLFHVIEFVAFAVTDLEAETAASLVGATGFALGIAASCLGSALVLMARGRLVDATVGHGEVEIEWTAGWAPQDRFRLGIGALAAFGPVVGLLVWQRYWWAIHSIVAVGWILIVGINGLAAERTYRVTPAGLERRRGGRLLVARQLTPWSQFEGFSVTGRSIVLHRQLPAIDVRCSRRDLVTEEAEVVAALDAYLDRRDS